jgi:hypothetical protein
MADLLYVLVISGFFGLAVLFVHGCERIIGPDPVQDVDAVPTEGECAPGPAKAVVEVGS